MKTLKAGIVGEAQENAHRVGTCDFVMWHSDSELSLTLMGRREGRGSIKSHFMFGLYVTYSFRKIFWVPVWGFWVHWSSFTPPVLCSI